jgi:hypothetical protein
MPTSLVNYLCVLFFPVSTIHHSLNQDSPLRAIYGHFYQPLQPTIFGHLTLDNVCTTHVTIFNFNQPSAKILIHIYLIQPPQIYLFTPTIYIFVTFSIPTSIFSHSVLSRINKRGESGLMFICPSIDLTFHTLTGRDVHCAIVDTETLGIAQNAVRCL